MANIESTASDVAAVFDNEQLVLARQLAGLRKTELAGRVGKTVSAITSWETGVKRPTAASVRELALALGVDPLFFTPVPSGLVQSVEQPHFRSLRSTSLRSRDQAFSYGKLALTVSAALERQLEFPDVSLPEFETDLTPVEAARAARKALDVPAGPIAHIVRLMENNGVLVVFSPAQTAAVDAYSFRTSLRPVIILNPLKRDYFRQRFDVAHELAHLLLHHDMEPGRKVLEDQANAFAAEFLMPEREIRDLLPSTTTRGGWTDLVRLKERWGASIAALLYRARTLGVMSDTTYKNAMTRMSIEGWRRNEPGPSLLPEMPSLLPHAIDVLAEANVPLDAVLGGGRVPRYLLSLITSRTPEEQSAAGQGGVPPAIDPEPTAVRSLFSGA